MKLQPQTSVYGVEASYGRQTLAVHPAGISARRILWIHVTSTLDNDRDRSYNGRYRL
jgi:hypothetical protein